MIVVNGCFMNIFDAHIHTNFESMWLKRVAWYAGIDFSPAGLQQEMTAAGVTRCFSMGIKTKDFNINPLHPTPHDTPEDMKQDNIYYAAGINPYMADSQSFRETRRVVESGKIRALKIYLGYFLVQPEDAVYQSYYELAGECNIPVIFHTGGSSSSESGLNYAHPQRIAPVVENLPDVVFVMAHMGNPLIKEAVAVMHRFDNVYADLSGFIEGPPTAYERNHSQTSLRFSEAVRGRDISQKLLYGSDWPLTPMKPYVEFIQTLFPDPQEQENVFYKNAARIFHCNGFK